MELVWGGAICFCVSAEAPAAQSQPATGYMSAAQQDVRAGGRGELALLERKALGVDELVQEGVGEKRKGLRHGLAKEEGHEGGVVHSQKKSENREEGGTA